MEPIFEIGDVVYFKADKNVRLVVTGIGNDGYILLRYYDSDKKEFKKVELPSACFEKVEE